MKSHCELTKTSLCLFSMNKFLASVLIFCAPMIANAFELAQGLTPPGQQRTIFSYTGTFFDKAEFPQERANMRYQTLNATVPVYKTDSESVSVSFSGDQLKVDPSQNGHSELYDIKFGASYTQLLSENVCGR